VTSADDDDDAAMALSFLAASATARVELTASSPSDAAAAAAAAVDWVIRCVCGHDVDDGRTQVQCSKCDVWQHAICYGWRSNGAVPEQFECERCAVRTVACLCDNTAANARIVQCADCRRWQHMECVGLTGARPRLPKTYLCGPCARLRAAPPVPAVRRNKALFSPFAALADSRLRGELDADFAVLQRTDAAVASSIALAVPLISDHHHHHHHAHAHAATTDDSAEWLARITPLQRVLLEKYYVRVALSAPDVADEHHVALMRALCVLLQCSGEQLGGGFRRLGAELRLHAERRKPDGIEQRRAAARDFAHSNGWRETAQNSFAARSDILLAQSAAAGTHNDVPLAVSAKAQLEPLSFDAVQLPIETLGPARGHVGYRIVLREAAAAGQFICECHGRVVPLRKLVELPALTGAAKRKRVAEAAATENAHLVDVVSDAVSSSALAGDGPLFSSAPPLLLPDTPHSLLLSSRMLALDARECGSLVTRHMRRSCQPTAVVSPLPAGVSVLNSAADGADAPLRLGLFAKHNLDADSELTIAFDSPWSDLPYTPLLRRCALEVPLAAADGADENSDDTAATAAHVHAGCTLALLEQAAAAVPRVEQLLDRVAERLPDLAASGADHHHAEHTADDGGSGGGGGTGGGTGDDAGEDLQQKRKELADLLVTTLNPISTPVGRLSREERKMQQIMKRFAKMEGKRGAAAAAAAIGVESPVKKPKLSTAAATAAAAGAATGAAAAGGGRGRPRGTAGAPKAIKPESPIAAVAPTPAAAGDDAAQRKPGRGRPRGSTKAAAAKKAEEDLRNSANGVNNHNHATSSSVQADDAAAADNDIVRALLGDDLSDDDNSDGDDSGGAEHDGANTAQQRSAAATAAEDEPDFLSPLAKKKAWIKQAASSAPSAATSAKVKAEAAPTAEPVTAATPATPAFSMKRKFLESYHATGAEQQQPQQPQQQPQQPQQAQQSLQLPQLPPKNRPRLTRAEMVEKLLALTQ
jgi:hypothetical protein